jgi:hypothetical protein
MRGLIELALVFTVAIGWGVIELVALRLDKRRAEERTDDPPPPDSPD